MPAPIRSLPIAILLLCAPTALAEDAPALPLDWMSGCWHNEAEGTKEVWSPLLDDKLLFGYGLTMDESGLSAFEQMRIEEKDSGAVFYAMPGGGAAVPFQEVDRTAVTITFENPDHDYPKRIEYSAHRVSLIAAISKLDGTDEAVFAYGRCDGEIHP